MTNLTNFFETYLEKESIFLNKKVLQSNYTPEVIAHRDEQIQKIAGILAPCLKLDKPSNIFLYGKTGTGKTLSVIHTTNKLLELSKQRDLPIKIIYLNCKLKKIVDTEYRLIAHLAREFGKAIPPTGLPTEEVYKTLFEAMDNKNQIIILILDEIDQLVKKAGDELLYNLTRINAELKQAQISLIGISNDLVFVDHLDARIKSSLSEEEVHFPPYNALQIQEILRERSRLAFKTTSIKEGVIEKCAAYAAREHGDARRALELLRVAGELAERENLNAIDVAHIDKAEDNIERDRVLDTVASQPSQFQAVLYATIVLYEKLPKKTCIFTGEIYEEYRNLCKSVALAPLTQRRVSDVIAELDMLGIINAKVISKGRYGRTREISFSIPSVLIEKIKQILAEELALS